jgi:hypothetical protein
MDFDTVIAWAKEGWNSVTSSMPWQQITDFLNSNFFSSMASALFGALFGAYAAHRIIERQKERELLLGEIRNTNAAISLAFDICNIGLSFKKQHLVRLRENFESTKAHVIELKRSADSGETPPQNRFEFQADLQTLPELTFPTKILQKQVFQNLSVSGRALSAVSSLLGSAFSLNESIHRRNAQIRQIKASLSPEDPRFIDLYFGFASPDGHVDREFPETLRAIHVYTDDLIFFSKLICEDLHNYGKNLHERTAKIGRGQAPKINSVDFSSSNEFGLMPDENEYESWLKGYSNAA